MTDFKALAAPFPPEEISWRLGSTSKEKMRGMALAYLDARNVMDRLDAVCGPGGWQCRYSHVGAITVCEIGIKCGDEWVWKSNGAGQSDIEAEKGALSDALKRAGVNWGIGRYLYMLESPWVEIEEAGRSFRIRKGEYKNLEMILRRYNQSLLNPAAGPSFIAQARDEIAQMQNAGDQPAAPQKTASRMAAEKFTTGAIARFNSPDEVSLWFGEQFSKTKTNRDKVAELEEGHPDLHRCLMDAAEEVRLRAA